MKVKITLLDPKYCARKFKDGERFMCPFLQLHSFDLGGVYKCQLYQKVIGSEGCCHDDFVDGKLKRPVKCIKEHGL